MIDNNSGNLEISLPVSGNKLAEFLGSLLGTPQSISGEIGTFLDVNYEWLLNLHEIINQRIRLQNTAELVSCSGEIFYEGGKKKNIPTLESLKTYNELQDIHSTGFKLTWVYLVKFPNRVNPERQVIRLSITDGSNKSVDTLNAVKPLSKLMFSDSRKGKYIYEIEYTERTWGDDIQAIIETQLNRIVRERSWVSSLMVILRVLLVIALPSVMSIALLYGLSSGVEDRYSQVLSSFPDPAAASSSFAEINRKLDILVALRKPPDVSAISFISSLGTPLVISLIFIGLLYITRDSKKSFVVFTERSRISRETALWKERRNNFIIIGGYALSIVAGVLSNYVFDFFKGV